MWKPKIIFHMSAVFRSPKRGGGPKRTLNAANRGPRLPNHPLKVLIGAVLPYSHLNPEKLKIKRTNYLNALFNAKYRLLLLILSTIVFVFPFYTLILSFSFISTNGYFCLDIGKRSKNLI